jgi:hypothetical protein
MSDLLRIVHLASLARSGETLLLRALAAHPQVHVVHDLRAVNTGADQALYRLLRVWPLPTLPRWQLDAHVAPGVVPQDCRVLVLKQGVFAPRQRPAGFGLIRNPQAVFSSLWRYDALRLGQTPTAALNAQHWLNLRLPRLLVWADACLPALLPALRAEPDPVRQFLLYWQARVAQILAQQRTVITYEHFVCEPEAALREVCAAIGLPFEPGLLQAHRGHAAGEPGHGGMDLSAPIRAVPAWRPDPLLPLAPFIAAVDQGPVMAWRGLYQRPPGPAPAAADTRAFDSALAAGQTEQARAAWSAPPRPADDDKRLLHMRRDLRLLQTELDALRQTSAALLARDPLALALEVSLLR